MALAREMSRTLPPLKPRGAAAARPSAGSSGGGVNGSTPGGGGGGGGGLPARTITASADRMLLRLLDGALTALEPSLEQLMAQVRSVRGGGGGEVRESA